MVSGVVVDMVLGLGVGKDGLMKIHMHMHCIDLVLRNGKCLECMVE